MSILCFGSINLLFKSFICLEDDQYMSLCRETDFHLYVATLSLSLKKSLDKC